MTLLLPAVIAFAIVYLYETIFVGPTVMFLCNYLFLKKNIPFRSYGY